MTEKSIHVLSEFSELFRTKAEKYTIQVPTLRIFNNFLVRNEQYGIRSLPFFSTLNVYDRISFSTDNIIWTSSAFRCHFIVQKQKRGKKMTTEKIKRYSALIHSKPCQEIYKSTVDIPGISSEIQKQEATVENIRCGQYDADNKNITKCFSPLNPLFGDITYELKELALFESLVLPPLGSLD